ncbi:MAG: NAD-dependent epimerase/dehydratase family protein [Burkholderiales bacterium]
MDILIFGATGMVGQSVLRECLGAPGVGRVVAVGRRRTETEHPRLTNLLTPDLSDLSPIAAQLASFDACFFCLGVSSIGMSEADYTRVTHDLTLNAARTLLRSNPQMTFTYVTGAGTDSTEKGKSMWARVKGRTENELLSLGFKGAYMFRPGVILPMHAVRSKTLAYRAAYVLAGPLFRIMRAIRPQSMVTSVEIGLAMLAVARSGYRRPILEVADIKEAARNSGPGSS